MAEAGGSPRFGLLRRGAGLALMAAAALLWLDAKRPDILISSAGDAVAVLGPSGRVPSKPAGGSFAVGKWLEADGDSADQALAAARPLWMGEGGDRWTELDRAGMRIRIRHLTGKAAGEKAEAHCREGGILVSNRPLSLGEEARGTCLVLDSAYLRRHGATAIVLGEAGLEITSVDEPGRRRLWH